VAITLAEPREHRLLRAIEQVTKHRIEVAAVPTLLDVRARRLDLTRGAVRDTILGGDLDGYRVVAETLADEFDPMDVAAAAVKLAHEATVGGRELDDAEIPAAAPEPEPARAPKGRKAAGGKPGGKPRPGQATPRGAGGMLRVFIGAGRKAGIRPADLVGAIANEAGVSVRDIGAIEIADKFSLVELSEGVVERVTAALRATTIKRKKVVVRVERPAPRAR
jgi:ATP-dependent RNA helicase DeaD